MWRFPDYKYIVLYKLEADQVLFLKIISINFGVVIGRKRPELGLMEERRRSTDAGVIGSLFGREAINKDSQEWCVFWNVSKKKLKLETAFNIPIKFKPRQIFESIIFEISKITNYF